MLLTPAGIAPITAGPVSAEKIKTLPGGSAPPVPPSFANSPDFWWKLDEESGTAVANSGGYGTPSDYDGTVLQGSSGSYSWLGSGESWGSGGITGGINLAASGDHTGWYIQLANHVPLGSATKITLAYWVEADNPSNNAVVFQTGNSSGDSSSQLRSGSSGGSNYIETVYTNNINTVGVSYSANPAVRFTSGVKKHVCIVLDFTLGSNGYKLYINGNLEYQSNLIGSNISADSNFSTYNGLITSIGSAVNNSGNATFVWDGALCDMRVWLDAATAADVTEIYTGEAA